MPHQAYFNLPEEKRERIRETALDLFSTRPYEEVTTRMLARQAGISMGSLYQYFESKDEMYLYFLDTLAYSFDEEEEALKLWSERIRSPREIAYILNLYAAPPSVWERYYYSWDTNIFRYNMAYVRQLQEEGILPQDIDLEMYAVLFVGLTFSSLMYCRMRGIASAKESEQFLKERAETLHLFLLSQEKRGDELKNEP